MTDPDDMDAIALDFAVRRLAQLAGELADPSYAVARFFMWWAVAAVEVGRERMRDADVLLAITRRVTSELVVAL
jgi:hypothetical protein